MNAETKHIMDLDAEYYLPCFGTRAPFVPVYGEGIYVYDEDGKRYADLLGGIAVNVLGHGNEHLAGEIGRQAKAMIHCSNLYYNKPQTALAERLCRLTGYEKAFFCNSGAEANEAAIKLARAYFYQKGEERYEIITAKQSFHGRTLATLTATGQEKFHKGFKPLPEGFFNVAPNDLEALKAAMSPRTAAILLEPIQGESGVWPMEQSYLEAVRKLCDETGTLLLFDEIQTGMGRTGTYLAAEGFGVRADITSLAKGLAGGVPIGAILTDKKIAEGFKPGMHGTTFGGNPLACAAGLAVLDEYERLDLIRNAAEVGAYFIGELEKLRDAGTFGIKSVRGRGLMLAFDLAEPEAVSLKDRLFEAGVLVNSCTPETIRLLPPLILTREQVDDFITTLKTLL